MLNEMAHRVTRRDPAAAVLLAAGRGLRLLPRTAETPKCLLRVCGHRVIDYAFEALAAAGVGRVAVVTHHLEQQVTAYVLSGFGNRFRVAFCHQAQPRGTADAFLASEDIVRHWAQSGECLLVCATDYMFSRLALAEFLAFHSSHSSPISVSLRTQEGELRQASAVVMDGDGTISKIVEKPVGNLPGTSVASLLFVVPFEAYAYAMTCEMSNRNEYEIQSVVNAMIANGMVARGYLQQGVEPVERLLSGY